MYVLPFGDKQINEVIDTLYYEKDYKVPYHYSDKGAETLLIIKGKVEVTLYGKTCECEEGDFINIPSYCPYSLKTLEEECVIRAIYTGIDITAKYSGLELLSASALEKLYDKDFIEKEFNPSHGFIALTEPVDTEKASKDALAQITAKGSAIYKYDGWPGISCELKVGRWNLKRSSEIWQYTIDKGYTMQYFKPNKNESLYSVKSGELKVEIGGDALFAKDGDLVHIPPYTPFTLTAISEKTEVYDLSVQTRLFRMLEMLELAQRDEPEKVADPEWLEWLLGMNGSNLTGFGF